MGRNISGVGDKKMVVGDTVHQRPCSLKILVTRTTNNFMQLLEIATGDLVIVFATYYLLKKICKIQQSVSGFFGTSGRMRLI